MCTRGGSVNVIDDVTRSVEREIGGDVEGIVIVIEV